jgi:Tyrosyl-DNA phosphodiesterase
MYIQDFPRLPTQQSRDDLPQFASEMLFFLEKQGLSQQILAKTCQYDFSKSRGVEFVHSMSGDHVVNVARHGKNGLASAIKRLQLTPSQSETLQLCYVVQTQFPANFCLLCRDVVADGGR